MLGPALYSDVFNAGEIYQRHNWNADTNPLMQFTGLHDKNGKEIYEGDFVRFNDERDTYVISWSERYLAFGYREGGGFADTLDVNDVCEIFGDVDQNRELQD